jgi:ubiquinone/menaquinone biosynthesis C-methylase UbiE
MTELGSLGVAEYVVAIEGLAMARNLFVRPADVQARMAEVGMVVATADSPSLAARVTVNEHEVHDGYELWAPRYDGPNPAIETEEPIFRALVSELPPGIALDAACGTGRHAGLLVDLGWDVIGVDGTPAMLDRARAKVPVGDFRAGRLEALPVDDASVDLVTCGLALTHVEDLRPVFAEFARVLRPRGRIVTTDMHTIVCETGGIAGFPVEDRAPDVGPGPINFVRNITHHTSEYVDAFVAAGLQIVGFHEHRVTVELVAIQPTYAQLPDATRQAFGGLPFLLIWEAAKR